MVTAELDQLTLTKIDIKLFKNVENVAQLRLKVLNGQLQCCLVNPKLVVDPFQLVIAANKALTAHNRTTKTVFTEILFNLSISKNISKSLQLFGITDGCREVLVVTMAQNEELFKEIDGEECEIEKLAEICDLNAVKKAYKIGAAEEKLTALLDSIVSRIATKDFISH